MPLVLNTTKKYRVFEIDRKGRLRVPTKMTFSDKTMFLQSAFDTKEEAFAAIRRNIDDLPQDELVILPAYTVGWDF